MSRKKIIRTNPHETFICRSCQRAVTPLNQGGNQRNHCPHCLCSIHVDIIAGDRRASCRGVMVPISVWIQENKEWSLIHRCQSCGVIKTNRIAADDSELMLFTLAASHLSQLPFPPKRALTDLKELCLEREVHHEQLG